MRTEVKSLGKFVIIIQYKVFLEFITSKEASNKNPFPTSERRSMKENGIRAPPTKRRKTLRISPDPEPKQCEVSVLETYRLGFEDKENKKTYIFNNIDYLEVSYAASVLSTDLDRLDSPDLFSPDPELDRQLSETASIALEELSSPLESILDAADEEIAREFTSRQLSYDDELRVLRLQTFNLLRLILPHPKLKEGFDTSTSDLDTFILRIIKCLEGSPDAVATKDGDNHDYVNDDAPVQSKDCCVVLVPDFPLAKFRNRVVALLKLLLPKLRLPESFDPNRDLQDLINSIYSYNNFKPS
ncbi:unnamed protein product [Rodentolepis nana]|uniref:BESS domain-containing protein n=1 Tax=Rodentolepis nana TaxID=102285 RepID=A0A0R3T3Q7_RODNA|nr:unnamed protein product [Rodentolepis nana]